MRIKSGRKYGVTRGKFSAVFNSQTLVKYFFFSLPVAFVVSLFANLSMKRVLVRISTSTSNNGIFNRTLSWSSHRSFWLSYHNFLIMKNFPADVKIFPNKLFPIFVFWRFPRPFVLERGRISLSDVSWWVFNELMNWLHFESFLWRSK